MSTRTCGLMAFILTQNININRGSTLRAMLVLSGLSDDKLREWSDNDLRWSRLRNTEKE